MKHGHPSAAAFPHRARAGARRLGWGTLLGFLATLRLAAQYTEVAVKAPNGGYWSNPDYFSPPTVPNDTAAVQYGVYWTSGAGRFLVDGNYTITLFDWTSGAPLGVPSPPVAGVSPSLTVKDTLVWGSGTLDKLSLISKGSLHWTGAGSRQLLGGSIRILGNARLDDGTVQLSDGATLVVQGLLDLGDGTSLIGNAPGTTGGGRIQNFGTLGFLTGTNSASIGNGIRVDNQGVFRVAFGSMSVGTFAQTAGSLEIGPGASLVPSTPLVLDGGSWVGFGSVNGSVQASCRIEPGGANSIGVLSATSLALANPAVLAIDVKNPQVADALFVGQSLQLGGTLRVRLLPGAAASMSPDLVIGIAGANANGISGTFLNVPPGGRIATDGGEGTFRVDYSGSNQSDPTRVTLADFRANPMPRIPLLKLPFLMVYGRPAAAGQSVGSVWLAMADGSLDVKLADGTAPRLSPDRKGVALLKSVQAIGPELSSVYLDLATGTETAVDYPDPAFGAIVGVDFRNDSSGVVSAFRCKLQEMSFASGAATVRYLSPDCSLGSVARLPNAEGPLLASTKDGIIVVASNGSHLVPGTLQRDVQPAWSPDGKSIVVANLQDLVVMPIVGGSRRSLLAASPHDVSTIGAPAWSPDGLWVLAPMTVDGTSGIFAVPADGSGQLARVAANLAGVGADTIGTVVFPKPFPDVHWSMVVKRPVGTAAVANVLDLAANTLDGWLGGINSGFATFLYANTVGSFTAVEWLAPGPWDQNPPIPTGSGGYLNGDVPIQYGNTGRLALPQRMTGLPVSPQYFGMRAPQVADFETMFGFPPPEGTGISRVVDGSNQTLTFSGGIWTMKTATGSVVTVPAPVADVAEAWLVNFGGPGILEPPADVRVTLGTPATFRVRAIGSSPLSYRWHRAADATGNLGAGDTFTIAAVRPEDLGAYQVEITDNHGTSSSRPARLSADATLRIVSVTASTKNPVALGSDVTLDVEAVGNGPLSFQWFRNGRPIANETYQTLALQAFQPGSGGSYTVRVTDGTGTVIGGPLAVLPDVPAGPFSDAFLVQQPGVPGYANSIAGNSGVIRGSNSTATRESGEPSIAGTAPRNSIWINWVPTASGIATFDTSGSTFDTRIAAFRSTSVDIPQFSNLIVVAENDDADLGVHTSRIRFDVTAGVRYFIAIDGAALQRGNAILAWNLEATTQHVPRITVQPSAPNAAPGAPLTLSVGVAPVLGVQSDVAWFRDGTGLPGAISGNLDLGTASIASVGKYYALIRQTYPDGSSRTIRSVPVDVQLYQRSNGSDPNVRAFDRLGDALAQFGIGGGHGAALAGSARPVGLTRGVSGTQTFSTVGETLDPGEPSLCGVTGGSSKWYPLACDVDGVVTVTTAGSTFDTVLAVYYDTGESEDPYAGLRLVGCNNDVSGVDKTSSVTFCARAGNIYQVAVDGVGGASGAVQLHYSMSNADPKNSCPAPGITCLSRPALRVATQGTTVTLAANVTGTEPLQITWYRGNTVVQTGPSSTLVLPNVGPANAGDYSVQVSNDDGSSKQLFARLSIVTGDQPQLGYIPECDGSLTFEIAGTTNLNYVVESTLDLATWTTVFTGSSTNGVQRLPVLDPAATAGKTFRARKQ